MNPKLLEIVQACEDEAQRQDLLKAIEQNASRFPFAAEQGVWKVWCEDDHPLDYRVQDLRDGTERSLTQEELCELGDHLASEFLAHYKQWLAACEELARHLNVNAHSGGDCVFLDPAGKGWIFTCAPAEEGEDDEDEGS
jgi:hypothetical protein